MKICFYLDNERLKGKDFSNPYNGNPGIGGTQYMIWTISFYFQKKFKDIDVILLTNIVDTMPKEMNCIKCDDMYDAINKASNLKSDIFVVRGPFNDPQIYEMLSGNKLNTVMWSHNFENIKGLNYASQCEYVKKVVCVGKQQYQRLRDHDIFTKTKFIYNALDFKLYDEFINNNNKENILCFMGAIDRNKGFHNIAKIWTELELKIPNLKLYVIGSGNLYGDNRKMGKFNIAEKVYEEEFMPFFLNQQGKIKDNVKFFGVLNGKEKLKVMAKAKVGIVNTTNISETFCISAIEFEALGVPVVSYKKDGLLDTVNNKKTGILIKSNNQMLNAIVTIMNNTEKEKELSQQAKIFVRENFDIYDICDEWRQMFEDIITDTEKENDFRIDNIFNDYKLFREVNRQIKKIYLFRKSPSIIEYKEIIRNLKKKLKSIIKNGEIYG